ncbi:LacI family DNA-binding transcriptional regulator [Pseudactinotalea sp. Z1748]|uniref:LacI family DNA-binding transcriptional regulator n=1 Tax=Pseudactinotalea sp. Z1748 TaxID=3413027 RepID=UPI003C79723D
MIPAERRNRILAELRRDRAVRVSDLAQKFGVAAMTIRRDLELLEESGHLLRVHGGAVPLRAPRSRAGRQGTPPLATVGLVVPSRNYYFPEIIRGAHVAAGESGVRLILAVSGYSRDVEQQQIRRLMATGVDALLVTPADTVATDPSTYRFLSSLPVPVIIVERSLDRADPGMPLSSVRSDQRYGAELAVRQLVERQHDRFLLAWRASPTAEAVRAGVRRAVQALRPCGHLAEEQILLAGADPADALVRACEVLDAAVDLDIGALLMLPDEAVITLLEVAHDRGIRIPQDLEIIAFDDEVSALAPVPVTAITPPKFAVGHTALTSCLAHLNTPDPAGPQRTALLPTLSERMSTRPLARTGP